MIDFVLDLQWLVLLQIVMIDILLGGDNAVAIALACRKLDARRRKLGILWGVGGAVGIRLALVVFALQLLEVPLLKVIGGVLLLWIGIKLLRPLHEANEVKAGHSVWTAVKTILIADFAMSLDNVIGIAGATQVAAIPNQTGYVLFGLLLSVPIVVWGSTLVLKLIDRYPLVITLGAGLLGWIAGGMVLTDVWVVQALGEPTQAMQWAAQGAGAALVIFFGKLLGSSMSVQSMSDGSKNQPVTQQSAAHKQANKQENKQVNKQAGDTNMTLLKWLALLGIVGIAAYLLLRTFAG